MNMDKNDNQTLKLTKQYDMIITVADECVLMPDKKHYVAKNRHFGAKTNILIERGIIYNG